MATFIKIVGSLKETLQKILIQGEIDEYENDKQMHCDTRLVEMLDKLSKDLQASVKFSESYLIEELQFLEEVKGIRLPHFIPHSLFLRLLKKKVNSVSELPINFVNDVWGYLETVCAKVLIDQCGNYPKLLPSIKKATEHVVSKMKAKFVERVVEMIEMEKITDYTCDPGFIISYNKPMNYHAQFSNLLTSYMSNSINVEGYGSINIGHLREVPENTRNQAFDLKIMMTSYWKIVLKRMVDCLALQLRFFIQKVVNKEMEIQIVSEVMGGGGIEKMLNEPPSTSKKRERLHNNIALLQESKETMEQVMDGVVVSSD
ncbi:putative dynamin central domain, GTPase effector domain, Dynamin superfamily [Helianthus annuus]|uniref:Dynamin central domain, GTPase effector domain, Dynamin superfamily n=2 Tax=Helianthus annuus TaxID=4232 RepID=A0A251V7K2_HELAN|nr:putative dynamin central domain, GTPase effector domain, Dynamin superfamily [Helianthus annuus]KAJ0936296.1 putative dynamin central domain, GTPase effector domain, Dynamin superfamily [Helianthus annuus]KAJ0944219.1 putative dynamin central domain, GTPase effector domain, Dynamin superfamily [Helianthus annuus]